MNDSMETYHNKYWFKICWTAVGNLCTNGTVLSYVFLLSFFMSFFLPVQFPFGRVRSACPSWLSQTSHPSESPLSHTSSTQPWLGARCLHSHSFLYLPYYTDSWYFYLSGQQDDNISGRQRRSHIIFKFLASKVKSGNLEGLKNVELHETDRPDLSW